jgi:hypothetical protein
MMIQYYLLFSKEFVETCTAHEMCTKLPWGSTNAWLWGLLANRLGSLHFPFMVKMSYLMCDTEENPASSI